MRTWIAAAVSPQVVGSQKYVQRLVKSEIHAVAIADVIDTITWSIPSFTVRIYHSFMLVLPLTDVARLRPC